MTIGELRSPDLELLTCEEAAQFGRFGHVALARFATVPPRHIYAAYRRALDAAIAYDLARAALIHIAEPASPNLDRSEMQAELKQLLAEYGGRIRFVAVVIVSRGFMSSGLRAIISRLLMLTRTNTKVRIFGELTEACGFVASETGGFTGGSLDRAVASFREQAAAGGV